jgi:single-stranded-DNA-specific exonuclease
MSLGIECLLARDPATATRLAGELDRLNRERRGIEGDMQASALKLLRGFEARGSPFMGAGSNDTYTLAIHDPEWHAGVVGILASRLKDRFHRPVFAFARDNGGKLKGSGRSIPGFHLRDALDRVDKAAPGVIERFGGHAAAAGATLQADRLADFRAGFESVAREWLTPADLLQRVEVDGELDAPELSYEFARLIRDQVWGQGFPEPRFVGDFRVEAQKVVGEKHLKLSLSAGGRLHDAIRFGSPDELPAAIRAVYRLDVNEYQGMRGLQLVIEHVEVVSN